MTADRASNRIPIQTRGLRRPGNIYAYQTSRVDRSGMPTDGTEVGYVGQTRQVLANRDGQHRGLRPQRDGSVACQPWSDIAETIAPVEVGVWDDAELDAREQYWIDRLRPRYNVAGNASPDRIPKFLARAHRDNRDRAAGLVPRQWTTPCVAPKRMRRRTKRRLIWSASILAVFLFSWLLAVLLAAPHMPPAAWWMWPLRVTVPWSLILAAQPRKRDNRRMALCVLAAVAVVVWLVSG